MSKLMDCDNKTKHSIWLRKGDVDFLKAYFPGKASRIMRKLISNFVDVTKAELEAGDLTVTQAKIDLELNDDD